MGARARVAVWLLGVYCLACSWALRPARRAEPVIVDFQVFLGSHDGAQRVAPLASVNIAGLDNASGFYRVCGEECPTFVKRGPGWTVPQMRFCRCIAERLVDDLNADFSALLDNSTSLRQPFQLGHYAELDAGQHLFDIQNGHQALFDLMHAPEDSPYYRHPLHLTVWIANNINGGGGSELEGTTLLDQPLYISRPGAGVLLSGHVPRSGRRLSHETGHVVGFQHVAGPEVTYKYSHPQCSSWMEPLAWKMISGPSCEVNIMGSWYDGPYCCPGSSLLQLWIEHGIDCLPNNASRLRQPYCCGKACSHHCPEQPPAMTFATTEHRGMLADVFRCWLQLRGEPGPARGISLAHAGSSVPVSSSSTCAGIVCSDAADGLGSCTPFCPHGV